MDSKAFFLSLFCYLDTQIKGVSKLSRTESELRGGAKEAHSRNRCFWFEKRL